MCLFQNIKRMWNYLIEYRNEEREINMTLVPMRKQCPKCKKWYNWNPDVGKVYCPKCYGTGLLGMLKKMKEEKK